MIQRRAVIILLLAASAFLSATAARAHDSRPLFVLIQEAPDGAVRLSWKTPSSINKAQAPVVFLTEPCAATANSGTVRRRQGVAAYACPTGLSGSRIIIDYPLYNPSISTLARVEFASGETRSAVLDPSQGEWRVPAPETFASVAKGYFALGVGHIIGGVDHLLFIAGLVYIARTPHRVVLTLTGFTLAHSLTIFLVALDVIRISISAAEIIIALSIVFLASEIVRNDRETLTWRRPTLVAGAFGLAHGAGFAAALTQFGLSYTDKIGALLFFNFGVETGQLSIIFFALAAVWLAKTAQIFRLAHIKRTPVRYAYGYGLGILSAYWFIDRLTQAIV